MKSAITGVKGIDHILSGGLPPNGLYLVSGGTGTGKTIFGLQFCIRGAAAGEKCLFLTLEESRDWIHGHMPPAMLKEFSDNEKNIFFLDLASIRAMSMKKSSSPENEGNFDMRMLAELLERWQKERNLDRCVIDGITSMAARAGNENMLREDLFYLGSSMKRIGLTTLLTIETSDEHNISRYGVEEFVSDGAFLLSREGQRRYLELIKVRGKNFHPGPHEMEIMSDGIHVYPRISFSRQKTSSAKTTSFGIKDIDTLLGGGLLEKDAILLNGSPGSGKTLFALFFINEALSKGEKAVYLTFKQSKADFLRDASMWGFDMGEKEKKGLLKVIDTPIIDILPHKHLHHLRNTLNGTSRLVIESIEDYRKTLAQSKETSVSYFHECLVGILKEVGVTSLLISDSPEIMGASFAEENNVESLMDKAILLRYVEDNSRLRGAVTVLKKRSGLASREIREFSLLKDNVVIGKTFEGMAGILSPKTTRTDRTEKFFS